jgi:hypothetical protein
MLPFVLEHAPEHSPSRTGSLTVALELLAVKPEEVEPFQDRAGTASRAASVVGPRRVQPGSPGTKTQVLRC